MKLEPSQLDIKLAKFHASWDLMRIQNITLEEYADLTNHDSLCYWLEYGSDELGKIGGVALHKFEIWKPNEKKELKNQYKFENGYFYNSLKGNSLEEVFEEVKKLILDVVINANNLNWEELDKIKYHAIAKWKLAFMFSDKKILPIYSKRALFAIAKGLTNIDYPYKTSVSILQKKILTFKNNNETIEQFTWRNYVEFAEKNKPNFYIVGSKYGEKSIPQINKFIKHKCIAIGFYDWLDFSPYIGQNRDKVNDFVLKNWTDDQPAVYKLQSIFTKIANLKEGDIIAVKSHGAYNRLTIIAYAQIVKRNGSIYEHNEEILGHHIHVEFLDAGFSKPLGLTYGETIHQLTKSKDKEKFDKVFGWYSSAHYQDIILDELEYDEFEEKYIEETGFAYNEKSEESFDRTAISSVRVNQIHNIIQNRFIHFLKESFPEDSVRGEKRHIDAKRETNSEVFIYEIKPYENVFSCIREGIGQLLDYSHNYKTNKKIKIIIVGPNEPNSKDLLFIEAIKNNIKTPFSYMSFDRGLLNVKEF